MNVCGTEIENEKKITNLKKRIMALNKSIGNMYAFVSHTYNPMKGECEHSCAYCFMRCKLLLPPLRLELKELKVNLGEGNFIFVGSSTDEWAANVPAEWIEQVLDYCDGFDNRYLFQSKNPARFLEYLDHPVMRKSVLCTTIETNRFYPDIMRNAPLPRERAIAMREIASHGIPTYVTCEPLMQFDLAELVELVGICSPQQVNIGRNSRYDIILPEPTANEVKMLKAELEQLKNNGYVPSGDKKADTGWLAFYIHPSTLSDNGDETMKYYSDTGAYLLSLEEFLYRLMTEPDYVFNATTGLCKVTVYANEYFYERDPMQENAPQDKDLWKTFANVEDRTFDLLVNTSHEISPDGQSRYHQAIVSIRQMSIKTVFVSCPDGMRVWGGVENVNETEDLDWSVKAPSEADAFYNKYYANGWTNTWKAMARSGLAGGFSGEIMRDPMNRGKEDQIWKVMTKVDNAKLTLSKDHYNPALSNYHATYACFTPFLRNRDNNRDGQMQAGEMQWYIPSVSEINMLYVAERSLPLKSRLVGHAPSDNATALFTSRAFMGSTNLTLNSCNPIILIEESHSMTPIYEFDYQRTASPGERPPYSDVRLVRDLGILETSEDHSYHIDEMEDELAKTLINNRTEDEYLIFKADNLPASTTRASRAIYELPAHDETSQNNTIYQKGFEVAKYIANRIDKPKDLNNPNRESEYYFETWSTLMDDVEKGNSPCAYYYQNPDKSDLGTWRLPNEAELMIMSGSLFDWDDREKKDVYDFFQGDKFYSLNMTDGQVIHSRTGFSKRDMNGAKSFSAGYQMFFNGYLRFVTTVDTSWGGDRGRLVNDKKGYVRCVRDLE